MDEVLVDLLGKSLYYYNKFYPNEQLRYEDINLWDLPGDMAKWDAIWRQPSFFMSIPPAPGAENALPVIRELEQGMGHKVYLLSSPVSAEAAHGKYIWFHSHLVVPGILPGMKRLILTRSKEMVRGDMLIDDGVHNLEAWSQAARDEKYPGTPPAYAIAYDRPWNQDWQGPRLHSFDSLPNMTKSIQTFFHVR